MPAAEAPALPNVMPAERPASEVSSEPALAEFAVPLVDGIRILVQDDLRQITPYVLIEQSDWFEDELRFLRHWLRPGQRVVDIGANHGVYSLCCARAVGPHGKVWAFEPAPATADRLAASAELNGLSQVHIERSAVSGTEGRALLAVGAHSELNELMRPAAPAVDATAGEAVLAPTAAQSVDVALVTLDDSARRLGWEHIDLLKIDAEGEEAAILDGGEHFLTQQSPLVMFEVRAGRDLHLHLVGRFAQLGYACYRLVPGLNLLVPFDAAGRPDDFLLNLFALKPDRAADLARSGHLVQGPLPDPWDGVDDRSAYHWAKVLLGRPFGRLLAPHWAQGDAAAARTGGQSVQDRDTVTQALALHALSQDASRPAAQRWAALRGSCERLRALCQRDTRHLRLASLARVADEAGERSLALQAMRKLLDGLGRLAGPGGQSAPFPSGSPAPGGSPQTSVDPTEPFLPARARFESVNPGTAIGAWVLASTLEALEVRGRHSSYFDLQGALIHLAALAELGFLDEAMQRRLRLVQRRLEHMAATQGLVAG